MNTRPVELEPGLAAVAEPAPVSRGQALFGLLSLALTICCASAMRTVFSPLQEVAKADLQLSDFQLSLVQGLAVSIPIAALSLPIGRMTDRGNRLRLLLAMGLVWAVGSVATAFVTEFYGLFLARMLAGIGAMCAIPVAISIAADLSTPERRGRSLLFLSIGNIAGGALAFALGGWILGLLEATPALLAALPPWRGVHLVFGAASLLLLLPLLVMREPARREVGQTVHTALAPALREIWTYRALLGPLFLGQLTVVMADTAAGIWAAPVLSRDYGLRPEQFAGWMGAVMLGAGVVGSLIGGFAADAGQRASKRSGRGGGILWGAVCAAWLSIPGAGFALAPDTVSFALLLALLLICGTITGLVTATAIAVLIPNEIRGVCLSAFIVISAIVGLGIAPTLVTLVSAALGGEETLRYALAISIGATSLLAALGFMAALRAARRS
ncbi:MAG: MFS transporter [Gammaproteobacteria bacterium]